MRVVAAVLAFLCPLPSYHGFAAPMTSRQSMDSSSWRTRARQPQGENRVSMQATTERPTRRAYFAGLMLKTVATVAVSGASSLVAPPGLSYAYAYEENASRWQPEGDPKAAASWFPLLGKCYQALEDVLGNWDKLTVKQDGDVIRRLIGTVGVSSPLSLLRKAFVSIRDAEEESQGDIDVLEFVEAYMEVLTALGDAENDLYSANFADYAGGGGTKGSQFIAKANKSLKIAKKNFNEVNRILGI